VNRAGGHGTINRQVFGNSRDTAGFVAVVDNNGLIEQVFRDRPDGPQFYDIPTMVRQNRSLRRMGPGEEFGIDFSRTVIIGDLGADMPIILDYGIDPATPSGSLLQDR
jgi:hypothetical protein